MYQNHVLELDVRRHRVRVRGQEIRLSATEFRLLEALVLNAGLVMSIDHLSDLIWGDKGASSETVRVFIGRLRRKLGEGSWLLIETVPGFGYRFMPGRGSE